MCKCNSKVDCCAAFVAACLAVLLFGYLSYLEYKPANQPLHVFIISTLAPLVAKYPERILPQHDNFNYLPTHVAREIVQVKQRDNAAQNKNATIVISPGKNGANYVHYAFEDVNEHVVQDMAILYVHGGGFLTGSYPSLTFQSLEFVKQFKLPILSVEYRMAPKNRYPVAVDDVHMAYEQVKKLETQYKRLACIGDSAGGNLCAALVLKLLEQNVSPFESLILVYPVLTNHDHRQTLSAFANCHKNCHVIDHHSCVNMEHQYMHSKLNASDYLQFPMHAPIALLQRLPKTLVIVAEHDILRDDGTLFYEKIAKLDNQHQFLKVDSIHGFVSFKKFSEQHYGAYAQQAYDKMIEFLAATIN